MKIVPTSPITSLKVLRGVPIHSDYRDTLTFGNRTIQANYFSSKAKYSFSNMTPVSAENTIRIPVEADLIADCNYIMFQNSNYLNKWFYAFIDNVKFVNSNMCEISVTIDSFQTWILDFDIPMVFVEREHTRDDTIGANLVDEGLELGEYKERFIQKYGLSVDGQDPIIILWTSTDMDGPLDGAMIQGQYSGVFPLTFVANQSGINKLNEILKNATEENKSDGIVAITMASPKMIINPTTYKITMPNMTINRLTVSLDGYVPKNNKLFTYPYFFATLTNNIDQSIDIKYEFLKGDQLKVICNYNPQMEIMMYPLSYRGFGEALGDGVTITNFPNCAYAIDQYKAWLAQNQGGAIQNAASGILGAGMAIGGALTLNPAMVASGLGTAFNSMMEHKKHESLPSVAKGTSSGSALFSDNHFDFYIYGMNITAEFAKKIDGFFSMYGYKTNELKEPNITGRRYWNYVKTIDCKVTGNIPNDDLLNIASAFDRGITFWHDQQVGNYNRDNPIV